MNRSGMTKQACFEKNCNFKVKMESVGWWLNAVLMQSIVGICQHSYNTTIFL